MSPVRRRRLLHRFAARVDRLQAERWPVAQPTTYVPSRRSGLGPLTQHAEDLNRAVIAGRLGRGDEDQSP